MKTSKTPESYFRWGNEKTKFFTFDFNKIGLKGKYKLRDVWQQKNIGKFNDSFKTEFSITALFCCECFRKNKKIALLAVKNNKAIGIKHFNVL